MIIEELRRRLQAIVDQMEHGQSPEVLELRANVRLELRGPDGELKDEREFHNVICTVGKRTLLDSTASSKYVKNFSYIAIGSGNTAAAAGDTALGGELARANSTVSNPNADTLRFQHTFAAGVGTGTIEESGLLDASSAGNLLARQTFSPVNKGSGDSLQVTWDIT